VQNKNKPLQTHSKWFVYIVYERCTQWDD